jgi:hypothetical protein
LVIPDRKGFHDAINLLRLSRQGRLHEELAKRNVKRFV